MSQQNVDVDNVDNDSPSSYCITYVPDSFSSECLSNNTDNIIIEDVSDNSIELKSVDTNKEENSKNTILNFREEISDRNINQKINPYEFFVTLLAVLVVFLIIAYLSFGICFLIIDKEKFKDYLVNWSYQLSNMVITFVTIILLIFGHRFFNREKLLSYFVTSFSVLLSVSIWGVIMIYFGWNSNISNTHLYKFSFVSSILGCIVSLGGIKLSWNN